MVSEFHEAFEWRRRLREHRLRLQLSQPEVARRAGLSLSAVKAYESGDRHPSREAITAITQALGLPVEEVNRVLAGAGYAVDLRGLLNERYAPRGVDWFATEVERFLWPVFVTNQASDVLAANRAFRRVIDMPLTERLPNPAKWNIGARASDPAFAACMENWDEVMSFLIGLAKSELRHDVSLEKPAPWTSDAFQTFLKGDPAYIARLPRLWQTAEPVPYTTRMPYRVRWRCPGGEAMRFMCTMHVADIWQDLSWHDWIPEDPASLQALQDVC